MHGSFGNCTVRRVAQGTSDICLLRQPRSASRLRSVTEVLREHFHVLAVAVRQELEGLVAEDLVGRPEQGAPEVGLGKQSDLLLRTRNTALLLKILEVV